MKKTLLDEPEFQASINEAVQLKYEQLEKLTEYKASVIYEYVTGKKAVI